jgi:hypothetical protein
MTGSWTCFEISPTINGGAIDCMRFKLLSSNNF